MKVAVVAFGRLNPITSGHEKLLKKIVSVAKQKKGEPMLFMSRSNDKKKNPLKYEDKLSFARQLFSKYKSVIKDNPKANTVINLMKELDGKYDEVYFIAGSDRVGEYKKLFDKYNGKEYNFKVLEVVSAGERDPDATDTSGMSASKLRAAAAEGNFDLFKSGIPGNERVAKKIYDAVRKGMMISEGILSFGSWRD